jgi:hypothetical protein
MCINMVQEDNVRDGSVCNLSNGRLDRYNDRTACEVLSLNTTVENLATSIWKPVIVENKLLNIESVDRRKNILRLQYGTTLIFCLIKFIWRRPLMLVLLSLVDNGILRPNLTLASANFLVKFCVGNSSSVTIWLETGSDMANLPILAEIYKSV